LFRPLLEVAMSLRMFLTPNGLRGAKGIALFGGGSGPSRHCSCCCSDYSGIEAESDSCVPSLT
jgi:hypothetical protein